MGEVEEEEEREGRWEMNVILATQEKEIRRIKAQSQPGK
jgi:hypothetical protein